MLKADTVIVFHVSTGMVGSEHEEEMTVQECIGDIDGMSQDEIKKEIEDAYINWQSNWLDGGWWPEDGE